MLPRKVNQLSLKNIFKEPIFTAVEAKSPASDLTNNSVHVHLISEHTIAPVELQAAAAMFNLYST